MAVVDGFQVNLESNTNTVNVPSVRIAIDRSLSLRD